MAIRAHTTITYRYNSAHAYWVVGCMGCGKEGSAGDVEAAIEALGLLECTAEDVADA